MHFEALDPHHISMRLQRPLPAVCARHGEPAIEYRGASVRFHRSGETNVQTTFGSTFVWALRRLSRTPPATTIDLFAKWPTCARCSRQRRYLRLLAAGLILVGAIPLLVLLIGGFLQIFTPPRSTPLGLAFIPIWFPCLLTIAGIAYTRATRYVRVQPITGSNRIVIRAHPHFAEAATA